MKIFIGTTNESYKKRLLSILGEKFDITIMSSEKELENILHSSFSAEFLELGIDNYPIVMLDYGMYENINLSQVFNNNEFFVSYFVLLCDTLENVDIEIVLNTNTALMIPMNKFSDRNIVFQLQLLINNFNHVRKIQSHACLDSLTQINNRHSFMKKLESLFNDFKQNETSFCFALIDLDHFKLVNDMFGHIIGDKVLTKLAVLMKQNCRSTDILGRLGGEEFAIIFPNTELDHACKVVERIREYIKHTEEINEILKVTLSAGIVETSIYHEKPVDLLENVDLLLYKAKDLGRDRVCT